MRPEQGPAAQRRQMALLGVQANVRDLPRLCVFFRRCPEANERREKPPKSQRRSVSASGSAVLGCQIMDGFREGDMRFCSDPRL